MQLKEVQGEGDAYGGQGTGPASGVSLVRSQTTGQVLGGFSFMRNSIGHSLSAWRNSLKRSLSRKHANSDGLGLGTGSGRWWGEGPASAHAVQHQQQQYLQYGGRDSQYGRSSTAGVAGADDRATPAFFGDAQSDRASPVGVGSAPSVAAAPSFHISARVPSHGVASAGGGNGLGAVRHASPGAVQLGIETSDGEGALSDGWEGFAPAPSAPGLGASNVTAAAVTAAAVTGGVPPTVAAAGTSGGGTEGGLSGSLPAGPTLLGPGSLPQVHLPEGALDVTAVTATAGVVSGAPHQVAALQYLAGTHSAMDVSGPDAALSSGPRVLRHNEISLGGGVLRGVASLGHGTQTGNVAGLTGLSTGVVMDGDLEAGLEVARGSEHSSAVAPQSMAALRASKAVNSILASGAVGLGALPLGGRGEAKGDSMQEVRLRGTVDPSISYVHALRLDRLS